MQQKMWECRSDGIAGSSGSSTCSGEVWVCLKRRSFCPRQRFMWPARTKEQCGSVNAIGAATEGCGGNRKSDCTAHLQDAHYKGAAKLGHGTGY